LAAAGLIVGWVRKGNLRRGAVLAATWLLLPPVALCIFQMTTGSPGLVARYWLPSLWGTALAAALALDAVWTRSRLVALVAGMVLVGLSVPTHVAIRTEDGHLGQRWRELPRLLASPDVPDLPLLAEGWSYRALVSNDPSIASRMPLVIDPAGSGRVNPEVLGTDSDAFRRLSREHKVVLVLQAQAGFEADLPTVKSFRSFRAELRTYRTADVLCAYFGEPLGVFAKTEAIMPDPEAQRLAERISAVQPDKVRCVVPKWGLAASSWNSVSCGRFWRGRHRRLGPAEGVGAVVPPADEAGGELQ
jgi:hypothetical protein